jgi:hypothetical protein
LKKLATIALGALIATTAAPALALDVPAHAAYLDITPCFTNCLDGLTIDATDGSALDSFHIDPTSVSFDDVSNGAELDPETSEAYFLAAGQIYSFNIATEDGLGWLSAVGGLPTIDAQGVGLAIDDATGTLYMLYSDADAFHYYLVTIDRETGQLGTPLEMPTALWDAGAYDVAILDGTIYVLTDVGQISMFNLSDGSPAGHIMYPELDWFDAYSIDVSEGGVLQVASRHSNTGNDEFFSYDLSTNLWGTPVATEDNFDGLAWYGIGTPAVLAETGFDPSGLALAAIALAGAGAVALRRRARR